MNGENGHWIWSTKIEISEWVGFIYQITHILTGRKYIGKKFFHSTRRKIVVNRKNKK
jgi:hypothetical protein